jgi:FkbM family methyltransferase
MWESESGTFLATLRLLFNKGVRYSTVIDIGCADGSFFLTLTAMGLIPGATPLNIDANRLYEDSLTAIKAVVGGDFRICAVTDHDGEVELTNSVHPYWSSLRDENDPYWARINKLASSRTVVPATTLNALRRELALKPPFLLKLDVQGAEREVLLGADDVLKDTHVVICEADIDDFEIINSELVRNDFVLFDLTTLNRVPDGTLGWFYPVYVNRRLDHVRPKEFWDPRHNDDIIRAQVQRREAVLKQNAEILDRMKSRLSSGQTSAGATPSQLLNRNDPCPCGSGKKYKHCCGAYR